MTHVRRSWLCAALMSSMMAVAPTTALAGGHGDAGRRPKPVEAPPAQPPAKVVAHGTTGRVVVEWAPVTGATHYRIFRGIAGVWTPDPIATVWHLRFVDHSVRQGAIHSYKDRKSVV